jgi:hypothetical protein
MPSEAAVEGKGSASEALAARVEGWVQYCEYFHLLDADMQVRRRLAVLPPARTRAARQRAGL